MAKKLILFLAIMLPQFAMAKVQYNVPFVSQAPRGNWKDAVFKDACEETSLVMAEAWIMGKALDPKSVEDTLHEIAIWEKKRFGFHQDTSVGDTFILANEYFHLPSQMLENISIDDIKEALNDKSIVVTAIDGSNLYKNGPPRHMIVVTGYDLVNNMFTYSDPMIAKGSDLLISADKLQSILRDYPSGVHKKVTEQKTAMIKITWPWILDPN
jgi:hypothetical protein